MELLSAEFEETLDVLPDQAALTKGTSPDRH